MLARLNPSLPLVNKRAVLNDTGLSVRSCVSIVVEIAPRGGRAINNARSNGRRSERHQEQPQGQPQGAPASFGGARFVLSKEVR